MKKGCNIGNKISKYIASGVLLFSLFSFSGCKKEKDQINELTTQVNELKAKVEEITTLNAQLTSQISEAQALIASLNAQIESKDLSIEELEETITTLNNTLSSLNNQIAILENTITVLQNDKNALAEQIGELQAEKYDLEQTIISLKMTIGTLQAELDALGKKTVTFDSNGGSAVPAQDVANGTCADEPTAPTRKGYKFQGWFHKDTGIKWNFSTDKVDGNITLVAQWEAKTYTVTYNLLGGHYTGATPSATVTYDQPFSLPGVAKDNYSLARWTYKGKTFNSTKWDIDAENPELKCEWALTNAQITYVFGYGDLPDEYQNVTYGNTFTLLSPERTGYSFVGWDLDGVVISEGKKWTYLESKTLTAVWAANSYNLTLDPVEGEILGEDSAVVNYDGSYTLPVCSPLSEDRPFAGWFIGNERYTYEDGKSIKSWTIPEEKTLEAKYFHPISTVEDFYNISENDSTIYALVNDIDFTDEEFSQIPDFKGELWGLGYSIKNFSYTGGDINTFGLFKTLHGATFKDITFKDSSITITEEVTNAVYYVGLLAAQAYGDNVFENVTTSNVEVNISLVTSKAVTGLLLGIANNVSLSEVSLGGEVNAVSSSNSVSAGGFVGESTGLLEAEESIPSVHVCGTSAGTTKDAYVGGLIGVSNGLHLSNLHNEGTIEADSTSKDSGYAGGLVGKVSGSTVIESVYNEGEVISSTFGGGIIGVSSVTSNNLTLSQVYNNGHIHDNEENGVLGGIIGRCSTAYLNSLYNLGIITSSNGFSGGLVGQADGQIFIDSCFNSGLVRSIQGTSGGLVGKGGSISIDDSYSFGLTYGYNYAGGLVGYSSETSKIAKSYVGGTTISENGYVGGFVGNSSNVEVSKSFIFALLKGLEGKVSSYYGVTAGKKFIDVPSAAILKDLSSADIAEAYEGVDSVSIDTFTKEYISLTLQFDASKWNIEFNIESGVYPTLKCFDAE